jgi:hypothetical protein
MVPLQIDLISMAAAGISRRDGRFSMKTKHGEAELLYKIDGNTISMYHTFTPDEDRGKGLAEKLALEAFRFAIEKHLFVKPDCPYIVHFLEAHPEYKKYSVDSREFVEACRLGDKNGRGV